MEVIAQLIVEKSKITFSWNFWFSNGCFQADVIFEGDGCIILTTKPPLRPYHWSVSCVRRGKNDINIAKSYIHKAADSGINEIFPSFSWTYLLFIY